MSSRRAGREREISGLVGARGAAATRPEAWEHGAVPRSAARRRGESDSRQHGGHVVGLERPPQNGVAKVGAAHRARRSWRVLLAHDPHAATCDALAAAIAASLVDVDVVDASSVDDARLAASIESFDACLICLDLRPAPLGGARLANELLNNGHPVVLVTRSLRWIPAETPALREIPWITPDAPEAEVAAAIRAAASELDSMIRTRAPLAAPHGPPYVDEIDETLLAVRAARGRR